MPRLRRGDEKDRGHSAGHGEEVHSLPQRAMEKCGMRKMINTYMNDIAAIHVSPCPRLDIRNERV